jgi:hypothetical protein
VSSCEQTIVLKDFLVASTGIRLLSDEPDTENLVVELVFGLSEGLYEW